MSVGVVFKHIDKIPGLFHSLQQCNLDAGKLLVYRLLVMVILFECFIDDSHARFKTRKQSWSF